MMPDHLSPGAGREPTESMCIAGARVIGATMGETNFAQRAAKIYRAMEGYPPPHPKSFPSVFVEFFCASHKGCTPNSIVTRIEYEYIDSLPKQEAA